MGKRVGSVDGVVVPARVIGDLIGLSDRQVRNLAQAGVLPKTEAGSYELARRPSLTTHGARPLGFWRVRSTSWSPTGR